MNKWQFALVQHPMILGVHEDRGEPVIWERIPPAGAADISEYAGRVRRNLNALKKYPDLKLNYEFSGVELQILIDNAPDIAPVMREMVEKGQLGFVGGDYSQPHGHLFSGELNLRQLEKGLKIFKELTGYRVRSFFHQETCLHDQLPQLLKAFGFETAAPPMMAHAITPVDVGKHPHLVTTDYSSKLMPADTDSVAAWRGLDGTEIPVVIVGITDAWLNFPRVRRESHADLYRCSDIVIAAPDMQEISPENYEQIKELGESILLDDALSEKVTERAPTWKARLHAYWSYAEGEWAEAVYRQIRRAEMFVLAEEALAAAHGLDVRRGFETDLRTILAAMHHDVHWIEITDLKKTYVERLEQVSIRSKNHIAGMFGGSEVRKASERQILVVNPLPYDRHEIVRLSLSANHQVQIFSSSGEEIPTQCVPAWNRPDKMEVFFPAHVAPLGSATYNLVATDEALQSPEPQCNWVDVQAGRASYKISENGTVLESEIEGNLILNGPGHGLSYLSEDGNVIGGTGRPGSMQCYRGELGHILRIVAPIEDIPVEIEFIASPFNEHLEFSTMFQFAGNTVGVMWEDWTKLNSYWHIKGDAIRHDIPYGTINGDDTLPIHAVSWVSMRSDTQGLAVLNTGTPKHFVKDGVLGCVLAWGGRVFTNRQCIEFDLEYLEKRNYAFDCTLHGNQTIRSGVLALTRDSSEVDIARAAQRLNSPLLVYDAPDANNSDSQQNVLDFKKTDLIVTAVYLYEGRPCYRFYEGAGKTHSVEALSKATGCALQIIDLAGNALGQVGPYQIGGLYGD